MKRLLIAALLLTSFMSSAQSIKVWKIEDLEKRVKNNSDTTYIVNFWATWCVPCIKELPDFDTINAYTIKVTRDAELTMDNDFSKKDINYLSQSLKQRKKGAPVRFIADIDIPKDLLQYLIRKNKISMRNVVLSDRFHNFKH